MRLFQILKKYGIPDNSISIISKLYKDTRIKFRNGKTTIEFESTVGVKQGDNLAPILFLFMIESAMVIIEMEFKSRQISIPQFTWNPVSDTLKKCASKDTLNQQILNTTDHSTLKMV